MTETTTDTEHNCNCNEQNSACSIVHIHSPVTNISICNDGCGEGEGGDGKGGDGNPGTGNPTPPATRVEQYFYTQTGQVSGVSTFSAVDVDSDNNIYTSAIQGPGGSPTLQIVKMASDGARIKQVQLSLTGLSGSKNDTQLIWAANDHLYLVTSIAGGMVLIKLTPELEIVTSQLIQDSQPDITSRLLSDADSNLYLAASQYIDASTATPVMLKYDADLQLIERKTIVDEPDDSMTDVCWDHTGKLVWLTRSGLVMRTDTDLALEAIEQLIKTHGANPGLITFNGIVQNSQHGFVLSANLTGGQRHGFLQLDSNYQYSHQVGPLFVDAEHTPLLRRLADGSLVFRHADHLIRLAPDTRFDSYLQLSFGSSQGYVQDSLGRLIITGSTNSKLYALPDNLHLSPETLAQSTAVDRKQLMALIEDHRFANAEVNLTLVSDKAITLNGAPTLTPETLTSNHTVTPIAP